MSAPAVALTRFPGGGRAVVVLGPSLGTSAVTLWSSVAALLADDAEVIGWDLPGHGASAPSTGAFSMDDLADGVVAALDDAGVTGPVHYAGDSIGGAVGLALALRHADRLASAALLCTGAVIGTPQAWNDRAAVVRASGTGAMVAGSRERWFAPGFPAREPEVADRLLAALADVDDGSYAQACGALAGFDVVARLPEVTTPVLAIAGAEDVPTPPASLEQIADGVVDGRLVVLDGVAHLAPAESPARVAELLAEHVRKHG